MNHIFAFSTGFDYPLPDLESHADISDKANNYDLLKTYLLSRDTLKVENLEYSISFDDWNFYYNVSADLQVFLKPNRYLLIIDGLILKNDNRVDYDELVGEIASGRYIGPEYDGQFNIILIKPRSVCVLTDLININKIYYTKQKGFLELSNNLNVLNSLILDGKKDDSDHLDYVGLFQLLTFKYTNLIDRTPISGVKCFLNGLLALYKNNAPDFEILDRDSTKLGKYEPNLKEIDLKLKENITLFSKFFNHFFLSVSAGVDSRVTLYSTMGLKSNCAITTFTHGENDDFEVRIAGRLADKLKMPHFGISIQKLYPDARRLADVLTSGLNLLLGKYLPITKYLDDKVIGSKTIVLIGDILDLLRAKNIKSIRSRKTRILIQLGLVKMKPLKYKVRDAIEAINHEYVRSLKKKLKLYPELLKLSGIQFDDLLKLLVKDIENTHLHLKLLFNPEDGYQYEEVFNLFVWGRGSMGNQSRLINQNIPCYVISANRRYVKYILGIVQKSRFEDKLVHEILKKSELGKFPTNQVPFVSYSAPLWLKYVIWATRSYVDQVLMKIAKKYKWKRNRLIKIVNWQLIYLDPHNKKNYESYFEGVEAYFHYPISLYQKRAEGSKMPLSEIDLTAAVVPAYLVRLSLNRRPLKTLKSFDLQRL